MATKKSFARIELWAESGIKLKTEGQPVSAIYSAITMLTFEQRQHLLGLLSEDSFRYIAALSKAD